jgi:hypothetical protein
MEKKRVEMKTRRVETGWFYAAPAVLNSLNWGVIDSYATSDSK